jgi:hypothetical protein
MPTTVKFRRGTTAQNDAFTGASGEFTVDTTLNQIRVHDGSTQGGFEAARQVDIDALNTLISTSETTIAGDSNTALDTVATSTADAATWNIVMNKNTDYGMTTVAAVKASGGTVNYTEYGGIVGASELSTFTVEISGGNMVLYADPTTTGVTFKVTRTIVLA